MTPLPSIIFPLYPNYTSAQWLILLFFQQRSDKLSTSCLQPSLERPVEDINKSNFMINSSDATSSNLPNVADQQDLSFRKAARLETLDGKVPLSSKRPRATADNTPGNVQMSDADEVIQMVTQVSTDNSNADDRSNNQISRQFPGPAGILPRLHPGLEAEPRLANLMRLHKGSDLRKYAKEKEQGRYERISPREIPTDYMNPQGGDNRWVIGYSS